MEFLPTLTVLSAFSVAAFILAITPGPDMTLFLSRAISQGKVAGMVSVLGASTGIIVHTLLAAFGISALIQASPTGFFILKVVGAIYLLWLAIDAIRSGSAFTLNNKQERKTSLLANWLTGIGVNLLNPKIVLFFITFLPQFVEADDPNVTAKMIFLGFYFIIFAMIITFAMIIAVDSIADRLKQNPKATRVIDWLFAGVFSAFAIRILFADRG